MKRASFEALAREWRGRLAASGFKDIEAPSGIIARRAVPEARPAEVAERERALAFSHAYIFESPWERQVWEMHAEGASNRQIARKLRNGRKRVEAVLAKLTAIMNGQAQAESRIGRPRDPDGFRSEGLTLAPVRLLPAHVEALGETRARLGVSTAEVVRRALMELRRRLSAMPEVRGQ